MIKCCCVVFCAATPPLLCPGPPPAPSLPPLIRMENMQGGCQLDLMLLWEAFDSKEASLLYPVNSLRNYARALVSVGVGKERG